MSDASSPPPTALTRGAGRVEVHQFVPNLFPRDAVGEHTLGTRRVLREAGMGGRIWAERLDARYARQARLYRHYGRTGPGAVILYQLSTGAEGMADFLEGRPEPQLAYYHNITPAEFFDAFDSDAAANMRRGRDQLRRLAPRFRVGLAASRFSGRELQANGVEDVRLVPPLVEPRQAAPEPGYLDGLRQGKRGIDILFVGRVFPHKGHRALLRVAALLRAGGLQARLFVVGGPGPSAYMNILDRAAERLGLEDDVILTGAVDEARLAAHYASADVFLCMSEHEGYCIPLVEAMRADLPVVACDAAAVAETLGGAGVVLRNADAVPAAEVVARVATDRRLRAQLVARQRARVAELDAMRPGELLLDAIRDVAEG
jgi:glycosyltransferase involved in cell wall biosynthesis